jgi:hypothetical protein
MFNWFKSENKYEKAEEALNNFKPEYVPQEEPERPYYTVGPTTKGRVMLKVHYGNVSMDETGINSLIGVLEASKAWLEPNKENGKQPDDGCQEEYDPL